MRHMTVRKLAEPGFGSDAYPGEMPQAQNNMESAFPQSDLDSRYQHDPGEFEPGSGEYKFFYGGGQLHVSPDHGHDELRGHAGVAEDHTGPMAVGHVSVNAGRATWQVGGNIALRGFARILKDYTKNVGWKWGGLTDVEGQPIDDSFAPKKSMQVRDNVTGALRNLIVQGKVVLDRDLDSDMKLFLTEAGYKTAEYPGGGNMNDQMTNYSPAGEQLDLHNTGENSGDFDEGIDRNQPKGTFKCPECSKLFNNWGEYMLHRQTEDFPKEDMVEDDHFPELDMDKTIPPHFNEKRPFILPLASVHEAEAYDEFEDYRDWLGITDDTHRVFGAYRTGEMVGFAALDGDKIAMVQGRTPLVREYLVSAAQVYYNDLVADPAAIDSKTAAARGFVRTSSNWKWSAGSDPKDQIDQPIPFIYDVQNDRIAMGHPGSKHSDIPGKFTPGGIVEGDYLPGGMVHIHTMTNMPYSVRHLIELWYWSLPHMEVTGVELHDNAGNKTKLASASKDAYEYLAGVFNAPYENGGYKVGDNFLKIAMLEDDKQVWLINIEAETKGTGLGSQALSALRGYSACKHKPFAVRNVKNPAFFSKFAWLEPTETGWDTMYTKVSKVEVGQYLKTVALADPAVWNAYKALHKAGGEVYVVGGAVRDALLQKEPKDIDLMVSGVPTEEVNHILSQLPGRVDLTGKNFGVYRYKDKGHEVEIALPRTETSTGDRRVHFDVKVDHNLPVEDDLLRRDFTINSMAVNLYDGRLVDPYGGAEDIEHRRLHTTHPSSFQEDPTRLARALVMASRYGVHPDERTRHEMAENAHRLSFESADALQPIYDKLFQSKNPARGIRLAHDTGLLKHILPEVESHWDFNQNNPHHNHPLGDHLLNVLENVSTQTNDPDLRMAALLHDVGKPASAWTNPDTGFNHYYKNAEGQGEDHEIVGADMAGDRLRALRWPAARTKRIQHIIKHHMFPAFSSPKGARKFLHRVGDEHADDLLTFRWADQHGKGQSPEELAARTSVDTQRGLVEQSRSAQEPSSQSALSLNGSDIIAMGVPAGPEVGRILRLLTDRVIDVPALNDRDTLLQLALEYARAI